MTEVYPAKERGRLFRMSLKLPLLFAPEIDREMNMKAKPGKGERSRFRKQSTSMSGRQIRQSQRSSQSKSMRRVRLFRILTLGSLRLF